MYRFLSEFLFDWGLATVSMFNTLVLFWLGFTVLLNAERRTWSVWLAGGGLLLGGIFFVCHTAMVAYTANALLAGIKTWWYLSGVSVIALPFGWYVLMLAYAGFWEHPESALHRRQEPLMFLTIVLAVTLLALLLRINPVNLLIEVAHPSSAAPFALAGVPLLVVFFPIYLLLCLALSVDALHRPGPTGGMMGDVARRRARPWLIGSSVVQLVASLMLVGTLLWIVMYARLWGIDALRSSLLDIVNSLDFAVSFMLAVAVILMGKAIVSYEIFTGKALPRRGFLRQWRSIAAIAAVYSIVVSLSWTLTELRQQYPVFLNVMPDLRAIHPLLITTVLTSVFYAVFSWRSYVEREEYMAQLRPFVTSQHLYEHLLMPAPPDAGNAAAAEVKADAPFQALCEKVLGAQVAYLVALGPLAPLVGPALTYPSSAVAPTVSLPTIMPRFHSPQTMCTALDAAGFGGAEWAVPLWSERGLIGVLLLGEKRDGSLYTQEEIEVARASGERLIDTLASAALAQRLMGLQRQRLAESQLLDRRARRVLHDDILPCLHTTMLALSTPQVHRNGVPSEVLAQLADVHRQISNLLHEMPTTTAPEVARLGLVGALRHAVDAELSNAFDEVTWQVDPAAEQHAHHIPSLTAEVLFYAAREAIRNAARYGRGTNDNYALHLRIAMAWHDDNILEVAIEDNGIGLDASRQHEAGSGHGLALHSTMMAVIGGSLSTESIAGQFTRVVLTLPPGR